MVRLTLLLWRKEHITYLVYHIGACSLLLWRYIKLKGIFYWCHCNFSSLKKYHYYSPILKDAITIFDSFKYATEYVWERLWPHLQTYRTYWYFRVDDIALSYSPLCSHWRVDPTCHPLPLLFLPMAVARGCTFRPAARLPPHRGRRRARTRAGASVGALRGVLM